jgi:ABC-type uncharacterized transport system substrate-binding protein
VAIAKATSTIPIVMASGADPVGFGLVKSDINQFIEPRQAA